MNHIERREKGMAYISDDAVFAQQAECRKILQQLNFMDRSDFDGIKAVAKNCSANPIILLSTRRFIVTTVSISKSERISSPTTTARSSTSRR